MKTITTNLHKYHFNISNPIEEKEYNELCIQLKSDNYRKFYTRQISYERDLEEGIVELDCSHVFSNQWVSTDSKTIFDWREYIVENIDIKYGYYINVTDDMKDIRDNTVWCGYCGHQEPISDKIFHTGCFGDAYIRENDLYLTRFKPAGLHIPKHEPLTKKELKELKPIFIEAQTKLKKKKEKKLRQQIEDKRQRANEEADGFIWLLDHGVEIDNIIYYAHMGIFCCGWKSPLSKDVEKSFRKLMKDFPFKYEFKKYVKYVNG